MKSTCFLCQVFEKKNKKWPQVTALKNVCLNYWGISRSHLWCWRCRAAANWARFYPSESVKSQKRLENKLYQRRCSQRSWMQLTDLHQNFPKTRYGMLDLQKTSSLKNIQHWKFYAVLYVLVFFLTLLMQTLNIKTKPKQPYPLLHLPVDFFLLRFLIPKQSSQGLCHVHSHQR